MHLFSVHAERLPAVEINNTFYRMPRAAVVESWAEDVRAATGLELPYADESFGGSVVAIDAKVERSTRSVLVRARVPNTALSLLPGMFVNIEVVVDESVTVLTVPETAISYNLYGDSVFVVNAAADGDGDAGLLVERRYVTTGGNRGSRVAVREGLRAGERVVDAGTLKLDHGAAVVIDNSVRLSQ